MTASNMDYSIVAEPNFVQATRDTGYRSTADAVAELLDNALEASARCIRVIVSDHGCDATPSPVLAVLDDGIGMEPHILRSALRFGGSERFNSRSGIGRFGMGLPNSSVSQCRRLEVYSWQKDIPVYRTYLDVDEIGRGRMRAIPEPERDSIPDWIGDPIGPSGTLVVWTRCDRLENRKAVTIANKLHREIGRKFRYSLFAGTRILINGDPVPPIDPLFCHPNAVLSGAREYHMPLDYEFRTLSSSTEVSIVRVRFSQLPIHDWHGWSSEQKRRCGISGGAGVSVVRAGREIAYGWHFLRGKRKQNYDDWWRCEVRFDPVLDEWFGVSHSKQGISPTSELNRILSEDMVGIANALNMEVRGAFAKLRAGPARSSVRTAQRNDWRLPAVVRDDVRRTVTHTRSSDITPRSPDVRYRISVRPRMRREFFSWYLDHDTLCLEINQDHPFFDNVYRPLTDRAGNEEEVHYLECLLLALARAEAQSPKGERRLFRELHRTWSDTLQAFLP